MGRAQLAMLVLTLAGCASATYPFPNRTPMAVDHDRHPFRGEPSEIFTPPRWDAVHHTVFRPVAQALAFERGHEAINVNALDEVPDSSWFTNRIERVTPERIAQGACRDSRTPPKPWRVIRKKDGGSRAGFVIRSADDRVFFARVDFTTPEHDTAADAIASRMIWAAGYNTPCTMVAFFTRDDLVLAPEADGEDAPTEEDIAHVIEQATRAADGSFRVNLGERIDGALGGWQFWGVRDDDPNDVVPHEDRREVRGMVVLSAWLDHIDSRAENNLDAWVETGDGQGYLRHYVLDASDSFGIVWDGSALLSQRFGISHYVDFQHIAEDFLTLGLLDRPYFVDEDELGPASAVLGYYDIERFDPEGWRNGYPNPAFERATERDRAWMARIIARMGRDDIEAAVRVGQLSRALYSGELLRIVMARRERILERYLTRLSPLSEPIVDDGTLCLEDLAVIGGIRDAEDRVYHASAWRGWPARPHGRLSVARAGSRACVSLPSSEARPAYWIVDVVAETSGGEHTGPARVHLYELAPHRYRVVGLERPEHADPPS